MDVAALIAWLVTATGGFILLGLWITKGGLRQQQTGESRLPAPVVLAHLGLAAVGLVLWFAYIVSDESSGLAWTAFGLLIPVALLGFTMVIRWWQGRQALATTATDSTAPAEQHFPVPIVVLHGLAAVTTVVLVLIAAAGAGD